MKAKKENKVYCITTEQEKQRYLKEGYDIYTDDGELLEYSPQKKISYSQYAALWKENEALTRERLALRSENETYRKENEALRNEGIALQEEVVALREKNDMLSKEAEVLKANNTGMDKPEAERAEGKESAKKAGK